MNKLSNNPLEKRRVTYPFVWYTDSFNLEELNSIENMCSRENLEDSVILGQEFTDINNIRRSKVKFINCNVDNQWIFDRFNYVIEELNSKYYNYDLYGYDKFQYTVYDYSNQGMYEWHMDTIIGDGFLDGMWDASTRKLTLIMLLNEPSEDFTGGEFQINLQSEKDPLNIDMKKGKIIAFPSFMIHRVKPVLSGIRKSIVIWVEGPKFR